MDAVVSIQGGEVSLKNGGTAGGNHRQTSVKRNNTEQSKTEGPGRHLKHPITNFDSPTKRRDFYNKPQTIEENRVNPGLLPQSRQLNTGGVTNANAKGNLFNKWADNGEIQSPKFTPQQIQIQQGVPNRKPPVNNSNFKEASKPSGYNRVNQAVTKQVSQKTSAITLNRMAGEGRGGGLSKSITINQNRKQIIQSLGRYNDIMSHENFEQEFETVHNDALGIA